MTKFWALLLTAAMTVSMLAGCGNSGSGTGSNTGSTGTEGQTEQSGNSGTTNEGGSAASGLDMSKTVKMGILVSDATSAEALAFRTYYTEYIQKQYNVELIYSDELTDAAGETSAIDTFITNNCKAVISFSSFDRAAQLEQCDAAGVYYAVATGTLTDEEYETYKGYQYYVGAIGPSLDVEFETGYNMAKHYLDQGVKNFAIFGGAIPYYTEMHIYRAAGMLTAMVEAGGDGASYQGADNQGAILGQIFADGEIKTGAIGDVNILGYVGGYDMDDAWFGKCAQMAQTADLEVILAVGNGSDFFGTAISGTDVKIASVDAYASSYGEAMAAGMLDYLAGKFSASIGPIFIATYRATLGSPIRTTDGNALALSQGYWVATGADEFNTYYAVDSSIDAPAYTKEMLDTLLTADYAAFESFVSKYSFEEIQGM
ncbi:MAG: sugar ABC transporter substrate-binding protein [Lachnospiraceae bacterium]|nr:sugar ABC transporter substrate-binding protein [Lachnospiraceae bacterium]